MTNHAHEGYQAHDHSSPQDHHHDDMPMIPMAPPLEAVQAGAQQWLAREFVGGLIAMAQVNNVNVADFLADKCMILSMRAANGEAEVEVLRAQLQAVVAQNLEFQQKLEDCHCDDDDVAQSPAQPYGGMAVQASSNVGTSNGDTST